MLIKFNFIVSVIFVCPSLYASTFIHRIVDGSLNKTRFNFSIFVKDFNGAILHIVDSANNQFGLMFTAASNNEKMFRINFNKQFKITRLQVICGCYPCADRMMTFNVERNGTVLLVICNNGEKQSMTVMSQSKYVTTDSEIIVYPMPIATANVSNKMYIMMGNIGPYTGIRGETIFPIKAQMIGCLIDFVYNDTPITFTGTGAKMNPSCQWTCNNMTCNGGTCLERISVDDRCDCSMTAFNGPYCNNSLTKYIPGAMNTFQKKTTDVNEMYFKMTWNESSYKPHCLMDIIGGDNNRTVYTNGSHVIIEKVIISVVDIGSANFVNVNFTKNCLIFKTKYEEVIINTTLDGSTRINIGFSETRNKCDTFDGSYDLVFNKSQIRLIRSNHATTSHSPLADSSNKIDVLYLLIMIPVGIFVLLGIMIIMLYRRLVSKKNEIMQGMRPHNVSVTASNNWISEIGMYDKVHDNEYDYIRDSVIYATAEA